MDSLSQITLGAAVGELLLGKKIGNRAMLWGAIAGTVPDLDVFANLFLNDLQGFTGFYKVFIMLYKDFTGPFKRIFLFPRLRKRHWDIYIYIHLCTCNIWGRPINCGLKIVQKRTETRRREKPGKV